MRDLNAVINRFANWQRAALQQLAQRAAFQQLGHQIWCAFEGAELMNGENVGMVECGGRLRLLLKTTQSVRILRNKRRQDLDRHFALQGWIASAINLAHSACTQQAENFVAIKF